MEYKFKPGQKLIVELEECIYEAIYESGTNNRVDLVDVKQYPCGTIIPGNLTFYRNEIIGIKILDEDCNNVCNETVMTSQSDHVRIKEAEYRRLEKALTQQAYICNADKRFFDLIEMIKNCTTCSVMGFSNQAGRLSKLSLLVLCVCNKLFIIDLKHMVTPKELTEILEADWIKKITFSGSLLADSLYHSHNIQNLSNVFDIQVADAHVQSKIMNCTSTKNRSLGECLSHYLNLPKSLLYLDSTDLNTLNWDERPITKAMEKTVLQHCIYLRTLKDWIENLIMKDVYTNTLMSYRDVIFNSTNVGFQESKEMFDDEF